MIETRLATTADEQEAVYRSRYDIYVEEMGRYRSVADHEHRRLADPEDDHSWIIYAHDGDEVVASTRLTWGGDGFSDRQVGQYGLAPFLAEIPAELMAVGERTMISAPWRGTEVFSELADACATATATADRENHVVFGACEPHLLSFYARHQRPYSDRNINSAEAGYLIPLIAFPNGTEVLAGLGPGPGLPRCVVRALEGTGAVRSPSLEDPAGYREEVHAALALLSQSSFDGLTEQQIDRCIDRSTLIRCVEGDRVLMKGGAARNPFLLLSGALEVSDGGHVVGVVLPGEMFGETALLLRQSRGFDVDVLTDDTRILALSERTLIGAMDDDAPLAAGLLGNLARLLCRRASGGAPVRPYDAVDGRIDAPRR